MGIIEKMRLDGKKGFVTGAARGIGKCTATAFAEAGADVAIVDLDFEEAQKTAKELAEKTGRKVIAIKDRLTSPEQVDAMVAQVAEELGGIDFCHNNAGICINAPAEEMTYEQWYKVININLNGNFPDRHCSRKIHACTWRRIYHQYSFHVSPHCKCTAATVCVQCIQSRSYPAYQIPGN